MAVGDSLPALLAFSLIEGYLLHRTVFADEAFRTVILGSLGVNLVLKFIYSGLIWPLFMNPLRHLPTIPVQPPSRRSIFLSCSNTSHRAI
jgi:hypothetical protein